MCMRIIERMKRSRIEGYIPLQIFCGACQHSRLTGYIFYLKSWERLYNVQEINVFLFNPMNSFSDLQYLRNQRPAVGN